MVDWKNGVTVAALPCARHEQRRALYVASNVCGVAADGRDINWKGKMSVLGKWMMTLSYVPTLCSRR